MSEGLTITRLEHTQSGLPLQPVVRRFGGRALKRPRAGHHAKSAEEFANYPEIEDDMKDWLVPQNPERRDNSGLNMLDELHKRSPEWAAKVIKRGGDREAAAMRWVRGIQSKYNVMFDARAIHAAKSIVEEALRYAQFGPIEIPRQPEMPLMHSKLRDDVPSVAAIIAADGNIRHRLLTPEERRDYDIHSVTVYEEQLSREALTKLFTPNETLQGENHG